MRVVGVGAYCEIDERSVADRSQAGFRVSEFAVLEGDSRVMLHSARGFVSKISGGRDFWAHTTVDRMVANVLAAVVPDDDVPGQDPPWSWLASLCIERSIAVTADELKALQYEVVLSPEIVERIASRERS